MMPLAKSFEKLLERCLEEAVRRGAKDPQIYFESESGLVVTDGPPHDDTDSPRHDHVLFTLPWPRKMKGRIDVGAW